MANFMQNLEGAIAKYGGEDEAYKMKLKNSIRDSLGYSNYVSQRDKALGKPIDVSLMKGNITPQGVKQIVGGAMDIKNQEVDTYNTMLNKTDVAAGQIASDRIAKEKAAASAARNKMGLENGVAFKPGDELDSKILQYMQNPTNPDGTIKTSDQFRTEMNDYFKARDTVNMISETTPGGFTTRQELTPEDINSRIATKMPQDYSQNQDKYSLMAKGYSEKQAKEYSGALRYQSGQMTEPEKLIFETQNPTMAKAMQENKNLSSVVKDASTMETIKDPKTGQEVSYPAYTYSQLKDRYPNLSDSEVKQVATPVYKKSAVEDIESDLQKSQGKKPEGYFGWLQKDEPITSMDVLKSIYNKEDTEKYPEGGIESVKKTAIYKEMLNERKTDYGDIFSDEEINRMLLNSIMERL